MRNFLIKVVIYFSIVIAIVSSINWLYTRKVQSKTKFDYVPSQIDICNFGSSHGYYGYNYQNLEDEYTCFNFALTSQTLSYDERILEYYERNLSPGGIAIIQISFFSPWGYPESDGEEFESKNKRYYEFLPPRLIKNYDLYTDLMVYRYPSLNDGLQHVVQTIFSSADVDTSIPSSYPDQKSVVDMSALEEDVTASCQRHIFKNKRNENGELFINEEEANALVKMVEICRKRGVTPIFVTCPYLEEYLNEIADKDNDFFDQFYDWINTMSTQLDVEYFDYSRDARFVHDYNLFFNGDHMNSAGATKFTDILYDEVLKQRLK